MNLGGASPARSANGLRPVFFGAPVPSGWTLIVVLSKHTCSIRMASICSSCRRAKTDSRPQLCSRIDSCGYRCSVPVAKVLWQASPFATVLHHIKEAIEQLQIGHTHVAPLPRQAISDTLKLMLASFTPAILPQTPELHK